MQKFLSSAMLLIAVVVLTAVAITVQPPRVGGQPAEPEQEKPASKKQLAKDPPGMNRLAPDADVWLDAKHNRVVMDGEICLREGTLEMFACLKHTKEHESILAVDTKAFVVHAALIAVGAKPGTPARFQPEYKPATGTPIDITLVWTDAKGQVHRDRAQDWVRNVKTKKAMEYNWVFAGSGFWKDDEGKPHYQAEGGDFICISNFPSAMLDLPVASSQGNDSLMFEAFTEHLPAKGSKVRMVLTPRLEKDAQREAKPKPDNLEPAVKEPAKEAPTKEEPAKPDAAKK